MTKPTPKSRLSPRSTKKVGPVPAAKGHKGDKKAPRGGKVSKAGPTPAKPKAPRVTRKEQVIKLMQRPSGVSIEELTVAFGILPHTARAMVSVFSRSEGLTALLEDGRYRAVKA